MQAPLIEFRASLMPVLPVPFESLTTALQDRMKNICRCCHCSPDVYHPGLHDNVEIHILQLVGKAARLLSVHPYGQVEKTPPW